MLWPILNTSSIDDKPKHLNQNKDARQLNLRQIYKEPKVKASNVLHNKIPEIKKKANFEAG